MKLHDYLWDQKLIHCFKDGDVDYTKYVFTPFQKCCSDKTWVMKLDNNFEREGLRFAARGGQRNIQKSYLPKEIFQNSQINLEEVFSDKQEVFDEDKREKHKILKYRLAVVMLVWIFYETLRKYVHHKKLYAIRGKMEERIFVRDRRREELKKRKSALQEQESKGLPCQYEKKSVESCQSLVGFEEMWLKLLKEDYDFKRKLEKNIDMMGISWKVLLLRQSLLLQQVMLLQQRGLFVFKKKRMLKSLARILELTPKILQATLETML